MRLAAAVAGELDSDSTAIEPIPVEVRFWPPEGGDAANLPPPRFAAKKPEAAAADAPVAGVDVTASSADAALLAIPVSHADYQTVTMLESLKAWAQSAYEKGYIALDTETDSLDSMRANLVGVSLATAPGSACYIPLQHKATGGGLFGGELVEGQVPLA